MSDQKFKTRSTRNANWDNIPLVEGVMTERGVHKDGDRPAPYIIVDSGVSLIRIYESKDLEEVFKVAKPGDHVRVEFIESVKIEGGRKFTRFDSSVWTGDAPVPA